MKIQQKAGHLSNISLVGREIDWLMLEWYECNKRILRKKTFRDREISLQFLQENPALTDGDILFANEELAIIVQVNTCDAIVVTPRNMFETASVCYEIGNKHASLFYEMDDLLIPFEMPLFSLLTAQGYLVKREQRKLTQMLRTTVLPHEHSSGKSLFSKIMQITKPGE